MGKINPKNQKQNPRAAVQQWNYTLAAGTDYYLRWYAYRSTHRVWISTDGISYTFVGDVQNSSLLTDTYHGLGVYLGGGGLVDWAQLRIDRAVGWNDVSILGDSISDGYNEWPHLVAQTYHAGKSHIINHAVGGASIMVDGANQANATAGDLADIAIIQLGTNDNNGGNMALLQSTYESMIDTIRANNPGVTVYALNVLPRWTDATGVTEVDKSNIRTAIAAACAAKSVTCWDSYSTPWIAAADTLDGLHPGPTGQANIKTQVLARLP